jgi:long-chain acyl-CoA synthetase
MFSPTLVHEYLRRSAKSSPEKTAIVCKETRWDYRTIDERSDILADVLAEAGVRRHDRVIIFMENSAEAVIAIYAVLKAGAAFVFLNSGMKYRKLSYIMNDCTARAIIFHSMKSEIVDRALESMEHPCQALSISDSGEDLVAIPPNGIDCTWVFRSDIRLKAAERLSGKLHSNPMMIDQDLSALIYTSGSTGEPKGVISSHLNMISAARSIIQFIGNDPADIVLVALPLSFDYGLYQVIMTIMFGGTIVLEKNFVYPNKVLELIEKESVTGFPIVPTIAALLLKMGNLGKYNLASLRYMTNTGAALPVPHIRRLREQFPSVRFFSMYGLTECKRVSYLPPEELDRRPSSVGKAIPNCEVFILDEEGQEVASGQSGELVIRGSNVMRGYWNATKLTNETYKNGIMAGEYLLYSGDLFRQDEDGYLYFLGRKDDMIKCRGERVSPKEVENALCEMGEVLEVAVIGVPDEVLGSAVKAFVVPDPGAVITERDVQKFAKENLEPIMVPKYVEIAKDLPRTANGKLDKKELKKRDVIS